jgi:K+-transporting ATPase ATPase C chain
MDLVTTSASGLDPEISPEAAKYQANRVARARSISIENVLQRIDEHTQERQLGIFGERRVNVLKLNLALDGN